MRTSDALDKLLPALVAARRAFSVVAKDQTAKAGTYSYNYADLPTLFDATFPALLDNGLLLTQAPDVDEQGFCLVTRVSHVSGQFMESRFPLKVYDRTQETGSLITYARRYAAMALLGVAAEDDDGAAAHAADKPAKPMDSVWDIVACIDKVDAKPQGQFTKYHVTLSTGDKVQTISEKVGKACAAAADDTREYAVTLKQTRFGVDIKGLKPLPAPVSVAAHLAAPSSTQSM